MSASDAVPGPDAAGGEAPALAPLHSLGPIYSPDDHGDYVALLAEVIPARRMAPVRYGQATRDATRDAIRRLSRRPMIPPAIARNIALTGHYGTGKSSILAELRRRLGRRAVNVSLSSLGVDLVASRRPERPELPPPLTNVIQKEIVKQLLYSRPPRKIRGSRYHRIGSFPWVSALTWSLAASVAAFCVATLAGLRQSIASAVPGTYAHAHHAFAWEILGLLAIGIGGLCLGAQRAFHDRFAITGISAGPAAVTLSARRNSYFDQYLDEIIHFFDRSKIDVAIFEDLDRFNDPHIFEALRELNTVLNNAQQIRRRPVRFIYAIRDSVFEQLEQLSPDSQEVGGGSSHGVVLGGRGSWDVPAASTRTKFFDLIVPVVPFISHRTARDLLLTEFSDVTPQPSKRVIQLVASYLTDMRLIKDIRNEYLVFSRRLFWPMGLEGLGADQLFAMTVYKVVYMADYELIRDGFSALDRVFAAMTGIVEEQTANARGRLADAEQRLANAETAVPRAEALGERLHDVMSTVMVRPPNQGLTYSVGGTTYSIEELADPAFWRSLATEQTLRVNIVFNQFEQGNRSFGMSDLETLLHESIDPEAWTKTHQRDAQADIARCTELLNGLKRATAEWLFERRDLTLTLADGDEQPLADISGRELREPLPIALVRDGYIDSNFLLYTASFRGVTISPTAMQFVLQVVQDQRSEFDFHFPSTDDIDQILEDEGVRFVEGPPVFNIEVFDHFLSTYPGELEYALSELAHETSTNKRFLDAYMRRGGQREELISDLVNRWPGVFSYIAGNDELPRNDVIRLIDAALRGLRRESNAQPDPVVNELLEGLTAEIPVLAQPQSSQQAKRIAEFLAHMEVMIQDLTLLAEPLRGEVISRGSYVITAGNLSAASHTGSIALDDLKATDSVYRYVLTRLSTYLLIIPADVTLIHDPSNLTAILNDIAETRELPAATDELALIARRAPSGAVVDALEGLDESAWIPAMEARRIRMTGENAIAYHSEHGFDSGLCSALNGLYALLEPLGTDDQRTAFAVALLDESAVSDATRIGLVDRIELEKYIDPDALGSDATQLLPDLVRAGIVADDATVWPVLFSADWSLKEQYFVLSKRVGNFVGELQLSNADLRDLLNSSRIGVELKRSVIANISTFIAGLDSGAATAIASFAGEASLTLSVEEITNLAAAGASPRAVLQAIDPQLHLATAESLTAVLEAMPDPYPRLAGTDKKSIHLPKTARPLLDRLKYLGLVTSYKEARLGSELVAYTRRK